MKKLRDIRRLLDKKDSKKEDLLVSGKSSRRLILGKKMKSRGGKKS